MFDLSTINLTPNETYTITVYATDGTYTSIPTSSITYTVPYRELIVDYNENYVEGEQVSNITEFTVTELYNYIETSAQYIGEISTHTTTFYFDPEADSGAHLSTTIIFHYEPINHWNDYMAIGYSNSLSLVYNSILFTKEIYYTTPNSELVKTHIVQGNYANYSSDETLKVSNNTIVYTQALDGSYDMKDAYGEEIDPLTTDSIYYTKPINDYFYYNGMKVLEAEVTGYKITLEADVNNFDSNGVYSDYTITVWADYIHMRLGFDSFALVVTIVTAVASNGVAGYLDITGTLTIKPDGHRINTINIFFDY